MKPGHAEAQSMFLEMGRSLGFSTRLTWSRQLPTDGVWLSPADEYVLPELPAVALEVAVSEGPKAIKGSIDTLAEVSPALGVLVVNDVEIRRSAIRKGTAPEAIERRIRDRIESARDRTGRHQQRFQVWDYAELANRHRLIVGGALAHPLGRQAA